MIDKIEIQDLECVCAKHPASRRIIYMIYPQVSGFTDDWLEQQAARNGCSIVMVYVPLDKWNDYLTPWPEPGETPDAEPFGGHGADFLTTLQTRVIPEAEKALGVGEAAERDLIGVSLAGLFTLWQWMLCDTFRSIACLSGSFWYEGFTEWMSRQNIPKKSGQAYFLLGTEEPKSRIKAFRSVGVNTAAVVDMLRRAGIAATFDWVPGNHFANPTARAAKALEQLGK